jgi:hypothetical protein
MKDLKRIADALESIARDVSAMRAGQEQSFELAKRAVECGEQNARQTIDRMLNLFPGGKGSAELPRS